VITRRFHLGLLLAALWLVAPRTPGLAQSSQPPTFRSTVDLLTIDTSVRDKGGQPVPDLQASDFTVTIDGRARKVVSALFFKADAAAGSRVSAGAAPTPQHVSNDRSSPGRVVVLALDAETIRGGQERALFETASRMIASLSPADAVGLTELPGPSIELSRDHSAIAEALLRFRGRARTEAEELVTTSQLQVSGIKPIPIRDVNDRAHTQQVLSDLAKLVRRMATVRAPRSVILISGGLKLDQELNAQYAELERAAAESRVLLYAVLLEPVGYETTRGETRPDVAIDPARADGLATIASRTGGMFFSGLGRAVGVFDRIHSEVTSFYQLALESSPSDADGKPRDVKVRVTRPGVNVRAPSRIAVPRPPKTAAPRDPLALALQQQVDVPDVPLAVATYNTQPGGKAIRLLVSAEVGAPNSAAPAEWGFAVIQHGKNVAGSRGRIPAGSERPRVVSTSVEVPPGDYQLRVAAVDAEDRIGVLEIPITAGYETASGAVLGDLVAGVAAAGQLEPRRRVSRSEDLTVMLEVGAEPGTVVGGTLQLIRAGSARSVLDVPLVNQRAPAAGAPSVSVLVARASLAAVPPGRYTASAAVLIDGKRSTQVSRVIEVIGESAVPAAADVKAAPVASASTVSTPIVASPGVEKPTADAPSSVAREIVRRVGSYVEQYGGQASLLVAVEDYSQSANGILLATGRGAMELQAPRRRRLISEFALVPNAATSGGWLGYRDVIEVDGKPVADRSDRLQGIFRSDTPDLLEARRIADEGARYNIGPVSRNFNVPTTALFFFHAGNVSRFTFLQQGRERIEGVDAVALDFRETRMPTLITNSKGKDVPASGTLWVDASDGAVVRTRLEFRGFDDAGSRGVIDVVYRRDPALAMWVPSRMTERYTSGSITATTVASYRDFKRFQTSVKIK
jgi:VWFA-related protein